MTKTSVSLGLLLLVGFTSCATYRQRRIDIHPVDHYAHLTTAHGISVAADSYHSKEKAQQGFTIDVTRKGFLPVNLILKNDSYEEICVRKDAVKLIDTHGLDYRPVDAKDMSGRFKKNPVLRFVAGSVISVVIGAAGFVSAILDNRKMRADWQEKEIQDPLIVEPGGQRNGFVYFKVPEGTTTAVSKLCLESESLESGERIEFEFIPGENGTRISLSPPKEKKPRHPGSIQSGR